MGKRIDSENRPTMKTTVLRPASLASAMCLCFRSSRGDLYGLISRSEPHSDGKYTFTPAEAAKRTMTQRRWTHANKPWPWRTHQHGPRSSPQFPFLWVPMRSPKYQLLSTHPPTMPEWYNPPERSWRCPRPVTKAYPWAASPREFWTRRIDPRPLPWQRLERSPGRRTRLSLRECSRPKLGYQFIKRIIRHLPTKATTGLVIS